MKKNVIAAILALAGLVVTDRAQAAFGFTMTQVGNDVVVSGTGTINTTGLVDAGFGGSPANISPFNAGVLSGSSGDLNSFYGVSGPESFGPPHTSTNASSSLGDMVGIAGRYTVIQLPLGYQSGSLLTTSSTYLNNTFLTLGVTPGLYTYTWGTGGNADSMTVNIVPEPSTCALIALSGLGLLIARRFRSVI